MERMSTSSTSDAAQTAKPLEAPAGLNLLGDAQAGSCCGGVCQLPEE